MKCLYIGDLYCINYVEYTILDEKRYCYNKLPSKVIVYKKKDKYYDYETKECYKTDKDLDFNVGDIFLDTKSFISVDKFWNMLGTQNFSKQKVLKMFSKNK